MKRVRKIAALLLAAVMVMAMGSAAFAAEQPSTPQITIHTTSDTDEGAADTTQYTWYRIFEADIETDPSQEGPSQSGGEVAYYVTTQDRATQIEGTGLFNVTQVGTENKWYVELKDKESTSAETIAEKFAAMDLTKFKSGTFSQTAVAGEATSGPVDPGYYYITSTAGKNVVIQTLKEVEIDEKNTFPTVTKDIDSADANAQIGDEINYTMTVHVPETVNDEIVLTDSMTEGLTFKSIDSVKSGSDDVAYVLDPATAAEITANNNTFTITFSAETVKANQGKTITITYTAILNNKAVVGTPETNTVVLDYGEHYTSKEKTADTNTYSFDFDKVDGDDHDVKLPGAEFELHREGVALELVELEAGKTYRIATSEDTTKTTKITTNGTTVTINGLDTDVTYELLETKAPTGYNKLPSAVEVKAKDNAFAHQDIENKKGAVLPSTGGIGTTIFYVVGGILVVGAAVILISKRRMNDR